MNKRIISALVLAGMMTSSAAFASKARELVLGTGGNGANAGSYYYESAYNMFYNPSYVNDYKNWAGFEKGTNTTAEFGFVSSMMNMNMGLWFNRSGSTPNILDTDTNKSVIDLLIGGDMGVKWGLGLNYGRQDTAAVSPTAASTSKSNLSATLGAQFSGLDPFVGFTIASDDKTNGTKVSKYTNMNAGVRYHYGEWTPYATYSAAKKKDEASSIERKINAFTVGLGREAKLAEGARLVYAVYVQNVSQKVGDVKFSNESYTALPVNVGVEADATSWLTLRAGAATTLVSTINSTKTTTARVGGTFHVGKVDMDYAFGNTVGGNPDTADTGFDSGTFHQVGMRYSW